MFSLINLAAQECKVSEDWVESVLRSGYSRVKKIKIPKKGKAGFRIVSRPSAELEILQRWVTVRFLNQYRIHPIAMAFLPNRSILTNAVWHKCGKYFIRVDFKDFFPSIRLADLVKVLYEDKGCAFPISAYAGYTEFLQKVCFDFDRSLPIGYISSPCISNLVMWEFDDKLSQILSSNTAVLGNARVTRYADDIVFSSDKKGACNEFLSLLRKLVSTITNPSLKINEDKTRYTSRPAGTAIVTGLRVCVDSHITVTRQYKDSIRLMLSLHAKSKLKAADFPVLRGHLAYVRNVAPAFYSKLCLKYVETIAEFL